MYNGKIESITLSFSRDLSGVIYDKFGGRMRLKEPAALREEMERQLSLLADRVKD